MEARRYGAEHMNDSTGTSAPEAAPRADTEIRERPHNVFTRSAKGGRLLSAMMLPFFALRPPIGFGILTTTGRKSGKKRRKCVRVIRRGQKAYLVMLGPALTGRPDAVSAWLLNIRANPQVLLRVPGATLTGVARELQEGAEKEDARSAYCETVNRFDYLECDFHLGWRPTREKITQMHRHWFETGIPMAIDIAPSSGQGD
jgi:deazaflavin-dependent oxidoreductase (nitroreductase family)